MRTIAEIEKELIELGFVKVYRQTPYRDRKAFSYYVCDPDDILFYWGSNKGWDLEWKLGWDYKGFHYRRAGVWWNTDDISLASFILLYGNME